MPLVKPDNYLDGPILSFLSAAGHFDIVYFLNDKRMEETGARASLTAALGERVPKTEIASRFTPTDDPRDYDKLYRYMRAVCEQARQRHGEKADYNVLLSPGTSQMHATWVLLTKTVFPANTWQTSEQEGRSKAELVNIPFDIYAELIEPAIHAAKGKPPLPLGEFVSASPSMEKVTHTISMVADRKCTVLLLGETGVGKSRIARLLHDLSPRKNKPFMKVNCTDLPPTLIESELFGCVRGAFTGATEDREGLIASAAGGTVFLDEIGELPLDLQSKLLRVIDEKTVRKVGGTADLTVDVRVVAATNQPLVELMKAKKFREDLYWRLADVPIEVPPMRDRPEDVQLLATTFLEVMNKERRENGEPSLSLHSSARQWLSKYPWPGNAREIRFAMSRLSLFASENPVRAKEAADLIDIHHLNLQKANTDGMTLREALDALERQMIEDALEKHKTQKAAAAALGLKSPQALQKRISRWGRSKL
jgi:DNA-binding NtrC family response regulator